MIISHIRLGFVYVSDEFVCFEVLTNVLRSACSFSPNDLKSLSSNFIDEITQTISKNVLPFNEFC